MDDLAKIFITAITSSGFCSLIIFLIQRKDNKKKENSDAILKKIYDRLDKIEKDSVRIQMLIMMNHYPKEESRIMNLAEHYFSDLKGNWYMTGLFNQWLEENEIGKPEWFKED